MYRKTVVGVLALALLAATAAWFQRAALLESLDAQQASARAALYPYTLEMPIAIDKTRAQRFEPGDEYIYWPN